MARYPWLKLHTEIVDDPKLADFSGDEFRIWIFLLCVARENDAQPGHILGGTETVAWRIRHDVSRVTPVLTKCQKRGMVDVLEDRIIIRNFVRRQYDRPSDVPDKAAARKRASRARHAQSRAGHATEERRGETDTEKTSAPSALNARAPVVDKSKPGTGRYAEVAAAWSRWQRKELVGEIRILVDEAFDARIPPAHIVAAIECAERGVRDGTITKSPVGAIRKLVFETAVGSPITWQGDRAAVSRVVDPTIDRLVAQAEGDAPGDDTPPSPAIPRSR